MENESTYLKYQNHNVLQGKYIFVFYINELLVFL